MEKLSSTLTWYLRYIAAPMLALVVFILATVILRKSSSIHAAELLLHIGVSIACGYAVWLICRFKTVHVDAHYLYIAGLRSEIRTPLTNIVEVRDRFHWRRRGIIEVRFRNPTQWGGRITFLSHTNPEMNWGFGIKTQDAGVVSQLYSMIELAHEHGEMTRERSRKLNRR